MCGGCRDGSLLERGVDEDGGRGALAVALRVLTQVHHQVFQGTPESAPAKGEQQQQQREEEEEAEGQRQCGEAVVEQKPQQEQQQQQQQQGRSMLTLGQRGDPQPEGERPEQGPEGQQGREVGPTEQQQQQQQQAQERRAGQRSVQQRRPPPPRQQQAGAVAAQRRGGGEGAGAPLDVRPVLRGLRQGILGGCQVLFSRVLPLDCPDPAAHPMWRLATMVIAFGGGGEGVVGWGVRAAAVEPAGVLGWRCPAPCLK